MHGIVGVVVLVGGLMVIGKLFETESGTLILGGLAAMAVAAYFFLH